MPELTFKTQADDKAVIVIALIVQMPPDHQTVVTDEMLYEWAGVSDPEKTGLELTPKDWQRHGIWKMTFRQRIQKELMTRLGRDFVRQRGIGFRLLRPGEVIPHAEDDFQAKVDKALQQFDFKASNVRMSDLTMGEANARSRAVARVGSVTAVMDYARRERRRNEDLRTMKSTEGNAPAIPPAPGDEDSPATP